MLNTKQEVLLISNMQAFNSEIKEVIISNSNGWNSIPLLIGVYSTPLLIGVYLAPVLSKGGCSGFAILESRRRVSIAIWL